MALKSILKAFPTPIQAQPPPLALTSEQRAQLGTLAERQECLDSHKSKEPLCWTGPWLHQLRLLHLPSLSKSSASHTRDHGGRLGVREGGDRELHFTAHHFPLQTALPARPGWSGSLDFKKRSRVSPGYTICLSRVMEHPDENSAMWFDQSFFRSRLWTTRIRMMTPAVFPSVGLNAVRTVSD